MATLAGLPACAPSAAENPTWANDIAPILAANCVRCHTVPAIGGAPDSFRLDSYNDWVGDDGRVVRGAATMVDYLTVRISDEDDPMPPQFGLADHQIETIEAWAALARDGDRRAPRGEPKPGNRAPTMTIAETTVENGIATLSYEIRDPDNDIVLGELRLDDPFTGPLLTRELHSGRGQVQVDVGALPSGTYGLVAKLDDGSSEHVVELGERTVDTANVAPRVRILSPRRDDIVASAESPTFAITVDIQDPDAGATDLRVSASARFRDTTVTVVENQPAVVGEQTIDWSFAEVPFGTDWYLTVTVTDGQSSRSATVGPFIVSHGTTNLTFSDIQSAGLQTCFACHPGRMIPGLVLSFGLHQSVEGVMGTYEARGLIYRRAIQQRNMPPASHDGPKPSQEDLDRLAEWLLAGAPAGVPAGMPAGMPAGVPAGMPAGIPEGAQQ